MQVYANASGGKSSALGVEPHDSASGRARRLSMGGGRRVRGCGAQSVGAEMAMHAMVTGKSAVACNGNRQVCTHNRRIACDATLCVHTCLLPLHATPESARAWPMSQGWAQRVGPYLKLESGRPRSASAADALAASSLALSLIHISEPTRPY